MSEAEGGIDGRLAIAVVGTAWPRMRDAVKNTAGYCAQLAAAHDAPVVFLDWWTADPAAPVNERNLLRGLADGWDPWQTPVVQPPWWDLIASVTTAFIRPMHRRSTWGRLEASQRGLNWWGKQQLIEWARADGADYLLMLSPGEWAMAGVLEAMGRVLRAQPDVIVTWPHWIEGADERGRRLDGGRGMPRPARLDLAALAGTGPPVGDMQLIALERWASRDPGRMDVSAGDARATLTRLLGAGPGMAARVRGAFMADLPIDFKLMRRQQRPPLDEAGAASLRENHQRAMAARPNP